MAMKPFCGYHMAEYWEHWLEMGKKLGEKVSDKIKEFFEKNKKVFIWIGVGIALLVLLGAGISSC